MAVPGLPLFPPSITGECIPIPTIFALMNQKRAAEGQPEQDYAALDVRADACIVCGKCEAQCPQHLHIRKLLQEVAKTFA